MTPENPEGLNSASEVSPPRKTRKREPSARAVKAALLYTTGQEKTQKAALLRADFSESVSNNPAAKGHSVAKMRSRAREALGPNLGSLRGLSIETLHEVMTDRTEPGSTRAATASATLKLIQETGAEDDIPSHEERLFADYARSVFSAIAGAKLYARLGPRAIEALRARLAIVAPAVDIGAHRSSLRTLSSRPLVELYMQEQYPRPRTQENTADAEAERRWREEAAEKPDWVVRELREDR